MTKTKLRWLEVLNISKKLQVSTHALDCIPIRNYSKYCKNKWSFISLVIYVEIIFLSL